MRTQTCKKSTEYIVQYYNNMTNSYSFNTHVPRDDWSTVRMTQLFSPSNDRYIHGMFPPMFDIHLSKYSIQSHGT